MIISVDEVVDAVYPQNLRRNLRGAAARNVRTHLGKLIEDGNHANLIEKEGLYRTLYEAQFTV